MSGGAPGRRSQLAGEGELPLAADLHAGDAPVPALDDLAGPSWKVNGSPPTEESNFVPSRSQRRVVDLNILSPDRLRALAVTSSSILGFAMVTYRGPAREHYPVGAAGKAPGVPRRGRCRSALLQFPSQVRKPMVAPDSGPERFPGGST